ncbi:hypothetical protein CPB86DRAFT_871952 [Serendipita vermifera]|nr:hypothetical protein CPB86DRAFT_871952 [Serendipita vermifera]
MSIQDSKRFPKVYGDFAIQSNDGIVCYFPRYLLAYMSPVFKDMMEIGLNNDVSDSEGPPPLKVTEASTTLEEFLSHLDPKTVELSFNEDTVQDLLAAAHKYQVEAILDRFEKDMTRLQSKFPLHMHTAREACRILTGCPSSLLEHDSINLSFKGYRHLIRLRKDRVKIFQAYIERLTQHKVQRVTQYDRNGRPTTYDLVTDSNIKTCILCSIEYASWIVSITEAINQSPCWDSFWSSYQRKYDCGTCKTSLADRFDGEIEQWRTASLQKEEELPEWPFGDD